jgi:hypothetical protein
LKQETPLKRLRGVYSYSLNVLKNGGSYSMKHPCNGCKHRESEVDTWCRFGRVYGVGKNAKMKLFNTPKKMRETIGCALLDDQYGEQFRDIFEKWVLYDGHKLPIVNPCFYIKV